MYSTNYERNQIIYQLWERGLTVEQISSSTGIPRSSVWYYVRKFNKLAVQGKPFIFRGPRYDIRKQDEINGNASTMGALQVRIMGIARDGDWEGLYYRLNAIKLVKELGFKEKEPNQILVFLAANL